MSLMIGDLKYAERSGSREKGLSDTAYLSIGSFGIITVPFKLPMDMSLLY